MRPRDIKRKKMLDKKKEIRSNKVSEEVTFNHNYLLTLTYDGYFHGGYAKQKFSNTIQTILEEAISQILKRDVKTIESSRTDAKVHALDQKVMFKHHSLINIEKFVYSINTLLPESIRVVEMKLVSNDFHCRYDVTSKTYKYYISTKYNIFNRYYEYYHYKKLDVNKMKKAAKYFVGEHDFTSFCSSKATQEIKVRTVYDLIIEEKDNQIVVTISGSGFLYNMVRIIVGTLIEVGQNQIKPSDIEKIMESKDRKKAGFTAPAHGLFLTEIKY